MNATVPCSTDAPSHFSHQHPPARRSKLRFDALPDQVCAPLHQSSTCVSDAHTFSGGAFTSRACVTVKPVAVTLFVSALAQVEAAMLASARARKRRFISTLQAGRPST